MVKIKPLLYAQFDANCQRAVFKTKKYGNIKNDPFAFSFKLGKVRKLIAKPQFLFTNDDIKPLCVKKCNNKTVIGKIDIGALYVNMGYIIFSGDPYQSNYIEYGKGEYLALITSPFSSSEIPKNASTHISLDLINSCDIDLYMTIYIDSLYTIDGNEVYLYDNSIVRLDVPIYMECCDNIERVIENQTIDIDVIPKVKYMINGDFEVNSTSAPTVTNRIYQTKKDLSFAFKLKDIEHTMLKAQVGVGLPPLEPIYALSCDDQSYIGTTDYGRLRFIYDVSIYYIDKRGIKVKVFNIEDITDELYVSASAPVSTRGFSFTLGLDVEDGCGKELIIVITPLSIINDAGDYIPIQKGANLFFTCIDYSKKCDNNNNECTICE